MTNNSEDKKSEDKISNDNEDNVEKHEINLQFHWYLFSIFLQYLVASTAVISI